MAATFSTSAKYASTAASGVAVEVVVDAVVEILGTEVDLVVFAGVLAVEVVRRADPVVVAGALVLAQQVPFDAAEDVHLALVLGLELGDGGLVLGRAAGAHAVFTVALGIAMAREAQCGQPLRTRSGGHLLQGVFAVAHRRVTMDTGLLIICHSESLHPFLFDLVVDNVSFFQFAGDVLHRDAGLHHQHQHMVCQIADLVDRLGLVFLFARDDDLSTLLAHLLEDLSLPFSKR